MRWPASPFGPASIQRRSMSESLSSWTTGGFRLRHAFGQAQHERQAPAGQHRRAPQHRVLAGRRFLDLEIRRPRLVSLRRRHARRAARAAAPRRRRRCARRRITSTPRPRLRALSPSARRGRRGRRRLGRAGQQHRVALRASSCTTSAQASAFCSRSHAARTSASTSSKAGTRPGTAVSTNTRCQPKPDSMGPCHEPGAQLGHRERERCARIPCPGTPGAVAVVVLEHEGVGERRRRAWASTGWPASLASACCRIVARARAAPVGREVQVPEAQPRRLRELGAVRLEPGLQLVGRRLARRGHVLGQELHLLRHAALDDRRRPCRGPSPAPRGRGSPARPWSRPAAAAPVASALGATATGTTGSSWLISSSESRISFEGAAAVTCPAAQGRTGRTAARRSAGSAAAAHAADVSWCAHSHRRKRRGQRAPEPLRLRLLPPGLCRR